MIEGRTLVPEPQTEYSIARGIASYELVPMLKREGRTKGVIISDSVELLEHISFSLPHLSSAEHIAVLRVEIDESLVVIVSEIRDTETDSTVHLWVVDEVRPQDIKGLEGILFSPPGEQ